MATETWFTPSATVTFVATAVSQIFALPAVDGSNTAAIIANTGPAPAFLAFGTVAAAGVPGVMTLQPGCDLLIQTAAASVISIAAVSVNAGWNAAITFQRGTATTARVF
jgi:hypothetical protein